MRRRIWAIAKIALLTILLVVAIAGAVAGWWVHKQLQPLDINTARSRWPQSMTFEQADAAARDLITKMSLDEKIDQMTGSGLGPLTSGLLLRGTMLTTYSGANDRLGIPPVAFSDGPRGVVVGHATSFPVAIARAASWDVELQRRVGNAIGQETRAQGANYWGGLSLNIVRHPSMGRAQEVYGEDPWLTGEMGVAILEAVQRHNVMACAKHFALNSMETARFKNDVEIDERTLQEVYFPHYHKAVEHGVATFMSAYNKVRGEWCGENRYLLTNVLREQWDFKGFVTSDWDWGVYDGAKGVHAGLDIEMPSAHAYGSNLKKLVKQGDVQQSEIDESVRRIVRTKLTYLTKPDPQPYPKSLVASREHADLAREVAEKSMVLLQNDGPLLPLDRSTIKRIAVVGRLADADNTGDHGSSRVVPPYYTSVLTGIRDYLGSSVTVLHADGSNLDEVRQVAKQADAVILVAGAAWNEVGEYISDDAGLRPKDLSQKHGISIKIPFLYPMEMSGGDLVPPALSPADVGVIRAAAAANPRTVVALVGGTAYMIEEWKATVPSIVMAWYFGMEGGHALARVLFGDVNPSGRMPLTTAKDASQLPPFDQFADKITYGPYHGYTLVDKQGATPTFPFGYGLSYTTFSFANLRVLTPTVSADGTVDVTVDVTNTGRRAGEEVVQLYVGFDGSKVERPVKLLRAFTKISLAPGEKKTVPLHVHARDLAWYDVPSKSWHVEEMRYELFVGPSSRRSDLLAATFTVASDSPTKTTTAAAL